VINVLVLYLLSSGLPGSAERVMATCSTVEQMKIMDL